MGSRARSARSTLIATSRLSRSVPREVHLGHAAEAEDLTQLVPRGELARCRHDVPWVSGGALFVPLLASGSGSPPSASPSASPSVSPASGAVTVVVVAVVVAFVVVGTVVVGASVVGGPWWSAGRSWWVCRKSVSRPWPGQERFPRWSWWSGGRVVVVVEGRVVVIWVVGDGPGVRGRLVVRRRTRRSPASPGRAESPHPRPMPGPSGSARVCRRHRHRRAHPSSAVPTRAAVPLSGAAHRSAAGCRPSGSSTGSDRARAWRQSAPRYPEPRAAGRDSRWSPAAHCRAAVQPGPNAPRPPRRELAAVGVALERVLGHRDAR